MKFKLRRKTKVIQVSTPPTLVVPTEVKEDVTTDGVYDATHVNTTFTMHLPRDPLVMAAMYQGVRPPRKGEERSSVTFDLEAARKRYDDVIQPVLKASQPRTENI